VRGGDPGDQEVRHWRGWELRTRRTGPWSAPALYALEGANIGFQLGGEKTDFVLLVMNFKGVGSLLKSKVKLGADAAAAAGPKAAMPLPRPMS
jgi:lipid-binding SYLF domain-containing protein